VVVVAAAAAARKAVEEAKDLVKVIEEILLPH